MYALLSRRSNRDYADFAVKQKVLGPLVTELSQQKLDILSHSDDIMVRVQ